MRPLRTLIVDDEPAARAGLRHLLREDPEVVVVGECRNGSEAVRTIEAEAPDLVFLDVQMPEMDGFAVLRKVRPETMPAVVFVTAFDEHALAAFEVHAVDYLLKPFDDERFFQALGRAKDRIRRGRLAELGERVAALLDLRADAPGAPGGVEQSSAQRLLVREGERSVVIRVEEIDWIGAEGDYLELHLGSRQVLLRETMKHLEARLDPARFVRIHRSTLVNVERIQALEPFFRGEYVVVLRDGTRLKLSRSCRSQVEAALGRTP